MTDPQPIKTGIRVTGSLQASLSVPAFSYDAVLAVVTFTDESTIFPETWLWDFGDGGSSTEQDPVHDYVVQGDYWVTLTITNFAGQAVSSPVLVSVILVPEASFTYVINGLVATFTDTSAPDPIQWDWDFGDTQVSSDQDPVNTYVAAGDYDVTLIATNAAGPGLPETVTIHPVYAQFTFEEDAMRVHFTDTTVGSPTTWLWDFGDGTFSSDQNPSRTYLTVDSFDVTLTASSADAIHTSAISVVTTEPVSNPTASFIHEVTGNPEISFFDTSGPMIDEWLWDFGDTNTSTEENPVHEYAAAGDYKVTLKATNVLGDDTTTEQSVRHFTWPGQASDPDYMHSYLSEVHPNMVDFARMYEEPVDRPENYLSFGDFQGLPFMHINAYDRDTRMYFNLTSLANVGDFLFTFHTYGGATVSLRIGSQLSAPESHGYILELTGAEFRINTVTPYATRRYFKYGYNRGEFVQTFQLLVIGNRVRLRQINRELVKQEAAGWMYDTTLDTTAHGTSMLSPTGKGAELSLGANYWLPHGGPILSNPTVWVEPVESEVDSVSYLPMVYNDPITENSWGSGLYTTYEEVAYSGAYDGWHRSFVDGEWVARILGQTSDGLWFPGLRYYQHSKRNTVDLYFSHQAMNNASRFQLVMNYSATRVNTSPYESSGFKLYFNENNPCKVQSSHSALDSSWDGYTHSQLSTKITDGVKRRFRISSDNSTFIKIKYWAVGDVEPVAWNLELGDSKLDWGNGSGYWYMYTAYSNSSTDLRIWDIVYTKTDT